MSVQFCVWLRARCWCVLFLYFFLYCAEVFLHLCSALNLIKMGGELSHSCRSGSRGMLIHMSGFVSSGNVDRAL